MNIVGIGEAGCKIANLFCSLPQYKVFCVDTEDDGYENFIKVKEQPSHEEYEKNYKNVKLKGCKGEITVILSGSGKISGLVLRLLDQIKEEKDVTILYIKPDPDSVGNDAIMRDRLTFGVLQQYARSNLFDRIFVVDNKNIETILESISIKDYWEDINKIIFSTYNMFNVYEKTEPLLSTFSAVGITSKIATLGVINYETLNEKRFYDLEKTRFKRYYFGLNDETINKEKDLLQKVRSFVKEQSGENTNASFAIFPTEYAHNYVYSAHFASMIQGENIS
jgi:hypothetical protein